MHRHVRQARRGAGRQRSSPRPLGATGSRHRRRRPQLTPPSTGAAAHCAVLLMLGLAGHRPGTAQSAAGARPRCSFLQQRWQVHCGHGCFHMLRGMELDRWWQRGAHGDAGHILARWARQAGHSCSSTTLHCNFARTIPSWRHPDPPLQGPEPTPKGNPSPRLILNLGGCHG